MKQFVKKPDTILAVLFTGKNLKTVNKDFKVEKVKEGYTVVTPSGNLPLEANSYIYIVDGIVKVDKKEKFESKHTEVK